MLFADPQLLERSPEVRLGVKTNVRAHPFFKSIDFEKLEKREILPPFKPKIVSLTFDPYSIAFHLHIVYKAFRGMVQTMSPR